MATSLLAHLYSRIKGSQEDVATISLQYIISSSDKLNIAFNQLVSSFLDVKINDEVSYSCQSVGDNNERPDMSGVDDNGNEVILCEMKFYAGLTSNQPNGYLDRLVKENGKALVFVCPEQRRLSLWSKIKELCKEAGKILTDEKEYRVKANGIAMTVISWREIIEMLERTAASVAIEALPDIAQLKGFCEMMDSTAFIPFSSEDIGPETARKEERYFQVIDRVFEKLISNEAICADAKGLKATPQFFGYIRYIRIDGHVCGLIYSRKLWMDRNSAETPFWFYFTDADGYKQSEELQLRIRSLPEYSRDMSGYNYPLYLPFNAQLDEIADSMMKQILDFIKKIEG